MVRKLYFNKAALKNKNVGIRKTGNQSLWEMGVEWKTKDYWAEGVLIHIRQKG